jgi:hypothetical protein
MCELNWKTSRMTHEYTYGVDTITFPIIDLGTWTSVRDASAHVMRNHGMYEQHCGCADSHQGAVEFSIPLLLPVSEINRAAEDAVKLLDTSGNIVQMPYTLQSAFARSLSFLRLSVIRADTCRDARSTSFDGTALSPSIESVCHINPRLF